MTSPTPIKHIIRPCSVTMHPLDNVIWQALTTRQTHCAEICGEARWFLRDITLLSAFREYPPLLQMIFENGSLPAAPTAAQTAENSASVPATHSAIVELAQKDSPEMLELATLTKPGPFGSRTHELGTYLGIRRPVSERVDERIGERVDEKEKLVAMAGERLKVPGHTEVSALCTHPEHTGYGYAGILMTEVMRRILARGEAPFLHVREDNLRAIALYQRLGFKTRR